MTLDDRDLFAPTPATPTGAKGRRHARHLWVRETMLGRLDGLLPSGVTAGPWMCHICGRLKDEPKSRRGKSSARLGKDQERRIERVYGPVKVGEFGDACDHLGRDWKWQAKATRKDPPAWLAAITAPTWRPMVPKSVLHPMAHMTGIGGTRRPLVIRSYVRHGVATRDWLFVVAADWCALHGGETPPGYLVIPGPDFLAFHGRDE
jgi:hypothetical protein